MSLRLTALLARGRMRRGHGGDQGNLMQRHALEALDRGVHADEREVELAPAQSGDEDAGLRHFDPHARALPQLFSPCRLEALVRPDRDRDGGADPHHCGVPPGGELRAEASTSRRMRRARFSAASPAAVSFTVRVSRWRSFNPSRVSRSRIWRLSGGCEMCSCSAARRKLSSSATATK
jgi:hypothetical protein